MLKILIADDHPVVRQGLKQLLAEAPHMMTAGEAGSGQELLNKVRAERWDAVVLDLSLPDRNGLDILKQIKGYYPSLPVLVLTMHAEEQYAIRALKAGASGFLTKDSAPEELVTAIQKVARGGRYVSLSLAERLAFDLGAEPEKRPHETLSDREFEILCMIGSGATTKGIADRLCLSVKTVSTHRARILQKMCRFSKAWDP